MGYVMGCKCRRLKNQRINGKLIPEATAASQAADLLREAVKQEKIQMSTTTMTRSNCGAGTDVWNYLAQDSHHDLPFKVSSLVIGCCWFGCSHLSPAQVSLMRVTEREERTKQETQDRDSFVPYFHSALLN